MWPFKKLPPSNQNDKYLVSARIKILDALTYCNKLSKEKYGYYSSFSLNDDPSLERFVIDYSSWLDLWDIYYVQRGWKRGFQRFREVDELIAYMGDFLNKPPNQMHAIKFHFNIVDATNRRNAEYFNSARIKILDSLT